MVIITATDKSITSEEEEEYKISSDGLWRIDDFIRYGRKVEDAYKKTATHRFLSFLKEKGVYGELEGDDFSEALNDFGITIELAAKFGEIARMKWIMHDALCDEEINYEEKLFRVILRQLIRYEKGNVSEEELSWIRAFHESGLSARSIARITQRDRGFVTDYLGKLSIPTAGREDEE